MEGRSSKRARKSCKIVHVKFLQNDFTVDLRSGQLALPTFVRTSGEMYGTGCVICTQLFLSTRPGVSSLGVPVVPWHPQILADQLTLSQPEGAVYAHQIILVPPDFQTLLRLCLRPAARVISRYNFHDISLSVNKSDSLQNLSFMQ